MRLASLPLAVVAVVLTSGCKDRSANRNAPAPPPSVQPDVAGDPKINNWLLQTAQAHNVPAELAGDWVAFTGTNVRMNGSVAPADPNAKSSDTKIVQVNFRVLLPDGRMVVQPVVGWGKDEDEAIASSEASFLLGSFHAFLGAFIDPHEQHVEQEQRTIGGRRRVVTYGGVLTKTMGGETQPVQDRRWHDQLLRELDAAALPPGTHWVDVYNGFVKDRQELEIQLDNERWTAMERKMKDAPWPRAGMFTSVRQFIVIQDLDDPMRPTIRPTTRPNTRPATRPAR